MTLSFEQKLQNYADLAVKIGVGLQPGQRLMVRAPVEAAPLTRLVVASAYQAGARLVDVIWSDDALTLARFEHAPRDSFEEISAWPVQAILETVDDGGASLAIHAQDPGLLKDQDLELVATAQRVYQAQAAPIRQRGMANLYNWSVISVPIASWAARIFPDDTPAAQMARLWDSIFAACRVDQPDPVAAWQQHVRELTARKAYLNAKQYTALTYRGPGTDLELGLPDGHIWFGAEAQTPSGITFIPNLPTEEVFTLPHKDKVEGMVSSTKPLSYAGVIIKNFSLTFEAGRVVSAMAESGQATLDKLLATDAGAARLGEVALVPHSSPISQSGVLFYNSLFDENASSHLALGRGYRFCLQNGTDLSDDEFAAAGGNTSLTHVDFMIGSGQVDIDGVMRDGVTEPVMRAGEWAF